MLSTHSKASFVHIEGEVMFHANPHARRSKTQFIFNLNTQIWYIRLAAFSLKFEWRGRVGTI